MKSQIMRENETQTQGLLHHKQGFITQMKYLHTWKTSFKVEHS